MQSLVCQAFARVVPLSTFSEPSNRIHFHDLCRVRASVYSRSLELKAATEGATPLSACEICGGSGMLPSGAFEGKNTVKQVKAIGKAPELGFNSILCLDNLAKKSGRVHTMLKH